MPDESAAILLAARLDAGMSQVELARRAAVTQPAISAYERGRREPSLRTLSRLVEATGNRLHVEVLPPAAAPRHLPDTARAAQLHRLRQEIIDLAAVRGATNVRVFGSVARGDDTEASDIDFLVDLAPDVGLFALAGLTRELTTLLGRDVDVVPADGLKAGLAEDALREAIPL